uniref:Pyrin domain-containing protein n=1 Tax=Sinocyclocheilus grahami TaxID=75366 RepID=A0A672QIB8_SINGR
MTSVKKLLVDSLKELVGAELKEFQWHLVNLHHEDLSRSELEKADRLDTVDIMVARFEAEEAVKVMVDILRKMNQNDLAEQLENEQKQEIMAGHIFFRFEKSTCMGKRGRMVTLLHRHRPLLEMAMASVKVLLLNSLQELEEAELKKFQWYLKNDHECMSKCEMENADRLKTVDKLVACFGPEEAVKITVKILRELKHNQLAKQLEDEHDPPGGRSRLLYKSAQSAISSESSPSVTRPSLR